MTSLHHPLVQLAHDTITQRVQHFLDTGFYNDIHNFYVSEKERDMQEARAVGVDIPNITTRRICRKIAKEQGRPFITIERRRSPYAQVTFPKRQFLTPMLAPVLLAGKEGQPRYGQAPVADLTYYHRPSQILVFFYNQELLATFMQMWDAPEMRAARRAPVAPEQVHTNLMR